MSIFPDSGSTIGGPLVAAPVSVSSPFDGLWLVQDGMGLADAIGSGNWVEGGMAAFSLLADGLAFAIDPIGSLIGMGLSWVLEHIWPLNDYLNALTGNAGEVLRMSQTWANISTQLSGAGADLRTFLNDLEGLEGQAMDAYRAFQRDVADHIDVTATVASATSSALEIASTIVKIVHDLTRDVISQIAGTAISAALTTTVTLGFGAPLAIAQVAARVSSLAPKVMKAIEALLRSMEALTPLLKKVDELYAALKRVLDKVLPGGGGSHKPGNGTPEGTPAHPRPPDSGLTDDLSDQIVATDKGSRPDPSTYLSPEYISQHLEKFDDGATRFMTQSNFDKYGIGQRDGTAFVMPTSEVDALIARTGGDPRLMEDALGLPEGFFDTGVVRVDIPDPGDVHMPSGNEAGANDQWVPGGTLPGGFSEAVVDTGGMSPGDYDVESFGGTGGGK